ncbi:MAG: hypothetical protein ACTS4Z_00515 [Candidatus Hodgkinia cicadicola]
MSSPSEEGNWSIEGMASQNEETNRGREPFVKLTNEAMPEVCIW